MAGAFTIKTAADLLQKLERDYTRLCRNPIDADAAFDFFVTAAHMPEWTFRGHRQSIDRVKKVTIINVCAHLANGFKHFMRIDGADPPTSGSRVRNGAFNSGFSNGFNISRLVVDLDGQAAMELGLEIDADELARRVLDFWRNEVKAV